MAFNFSEGINKFVKATLEALKGGADLDDFKIVISEADDEAIDIIAKPKGMVEAGDNPLDFPEYTGDDIEFAVALTERVSELVKSRAQSIGGRKAARNMSAEERSARAKKAVEARIKKYGQGNKTIEERRAYQREWARKKRQSAK